MFWKKQVSLSFFRVHKKGNGLNAFEACCMQIVCKREKAFSAKPLKAFSIAWSHLGMIQGPPDYESGALTN